MTYSLFIGRYQPFHSGHKKLIQVVLDEGKNVCIAIRDTEKSKNNPYSIKERKEMIRKAYSDSDRKRVKIIEIPDIKEVCYGRKVGWGIRKIKLDVETEKISASKIRNDHLDNR